MLDADRLQQLLLGCAWENQQAFATLYEHTAPYLMTMATRIVSNSSQAEEVLQEAFVQVWYNAKTYDPNRGTAMAWLTGIVRHRALDMRRRETRLTERHDALAQEREIALDQHQRNPSDNSPELQTLLDCLDHLQGAQRQSILLAY